ncbi:MAG: 2-C-methyl-D-erythritol 4-phosphate cytidylyltransferase [Lachnospiraceae bacterium]|nr:2-C-methyl-D-erythritol 4-phosphate cytidylyltransferase [Lachnospiraceae bacterium]
MKNIAIVLAGGSGRRMGGDKPKQYMMLGSKPLICYCLETMERSFMDAVVLVCKSGDEDFCKREIVDNYGFKKIKAIVPGGRERYDSVYNGLKETEGYDHVFIHDGARPFISENILDRCLHYVEKYGAAAAAVRAKDTVKIENGDGFIEQSPDRSYVWMVQTPQVFDRDMIASCYEKLKRDESRLLDAGVYITDDTMVAKMYADVDAKLVESSFDNIKITTAGDMPIAEAILNKRIGENGC